MPSALPPQLAIDAFNRQLREIAKETEKELSQELRRIGNEARDVVRGSTEDPYETGGLRRSVKTSVRRKSEVSVYSNLPQAPVHEFGGTIKPRGRPITIERTNFVSGTVLALGDEIDSEIGEAFDKVARRNGFL